MTTKIEWTEETWNPTTGCDRVSRGCDNCYALTLAKRMKAIGQPKYQRDGDPRTSGPGFGLTCHPDTLETPLRWRKPRRVFVNSMSDLFHPEVPDEFVSQVFDVMERAQQHTFQVLTKRPQRMASLVRRFRTLGAGWFLDDDGAHGESMAFPNVWLGTSIESDRYAFRANHLRRTPAAVRFISAEPLLGPLPSLDLTDIDWLIIGGESGRGHRSMEIAWAEELVEMCRTAGTAVFVKQLGSSFGRNHHDIDTFPESLRIREYPR